MDGVIASDRAPAAVGPYVQARVAAGLLFCSGQIPLDCSGQLAASDMEGQSRQVLENLRQVLSAAGVGLAQVVKTTCFLSDMAHFAQFNAVYQQYFQAPYPARSCVAVRSLPLNVLVEVEAIALLC